MLMYLLISIAIASHGLYDDAHGPHDDAHGLYDDDTTIDISGDLIPMDDPDFLEELRYLSWPHPQEVPGQPTIRYLSDDEFQRLLREDEGAHEGTHEGNHQGTHEGTHEDASRGFKRSARLVAQRIELPKNSA